MVGRKRTIVVKVLMAGVAGSAHAQEPAKEPPPPTRAEFDALRKRLETVEGKKTEDAGDPEKGGHRLPHFHGYGEVHFNRPRLGTMDADQPARADFHRMVLGLGQEISDGIGFDMEIDFEHAAAAADLELEYAFLRFELTPELTLRVGSLLMPVGPLNEFHEPPLFYSVERPYTQRSLIPTTWQEVGLGLVGRALEGKLSYRAYIVNGLDASKFNAMDGLRGGRGKGGREAPAEDLAGVVRFEFPVAPELILGSSVYAGLADQETPGLNDAGVALYEGDALLTLGDFETRAVLVSTRVSQADDASAATAAAGRPVGETMQGGYLETAYHVLRLLAPDSSHDLMAFARYEDIDTNKDVPSGFAKNPEADRKIGAFGFAYYPIRSVAIKADYERWRDGTRDRLSRWNLGAAFMY